MTQVRWGILGPGRIAAKVAADFGHVDGGVLAAVGSSSLDRARAFATEHGAALGTEIRAHGSHEALLDDPDVDAIYIATPHSDHARQAIAAARAGKAVLVEKSFTATLAGAEEVLAAARESGTFVMEAMWTRFQPALVRARELIADGAIGEVRAVQADLGVRREFEPSDRLFALELGGGALLDLGVYVVSFAQHFLGGPDTVTASGTLLETGVDAEAAITLGYADGRAASLLTSFRLPLPGQGRIFGTDGWIDVPPRFHHPTSLVLHRDGADPEPMDVAPGGAGYALEFDEVNRALAAGAVQSEIMPWADTLAVQAVLQRAADQIGVALHER
ncbi:Gfo/Idh/MocA family oxidoreductase [Occultella glacieicola]|uniref:Gfo/Idh/MocA family oxidoreductase n=1 Tax=Occultella glacieicola TaxID=2518684 RepID=A0ABY2E8P3_9MICO|nr:Gfo/Idh/MocA family oxidoreductase [Occultella glacieicola]TDE94261.1 Gfo/Idh/MocA family oxidoreductase [Occultella glacieicola]